MSEAPLDDLRRAVYRPVRSGNALEDTTARIVQTVRLGLVAPGESLPAERELASLYGVSRDTVREAIRELADAGWLETRRGRYGGTFVVDPVPRPSEPAVVSAAELATSSRCAGCSSPGPRGRRRDDRCPPTSATCCGRGTRARRTPTERTTADSTPCFISRSRNSPASPLSFRWWPTIARR